MKPSSLYARGVAAGLLLAVLFVVVALSFRTDISAALGALLLIVIVLALFAKSVYGSR